MDLPSFMGNPLFNVYSLTAVLNRIPYLPGLIGRLNLFTPRPLTTNVALIEVAEDRLALVPAQPRGAPANRNVMGQRTITPFLVPHFPLSDTVMADSILGVREFGTDDQLAGINGVITARLESMSRKHDVTLEHLRLGAIRGVIVTVVDRETGAPLETVNLWDRWNVPQPPAVDWPIVYARPQETTAWAQPIRALIMSVQRHMASKLGGAPLGAIACICGARFFDAIATAAEVRQTFLNTPQAASLRESLYGLAISYAGCLFQEYMGGVGAYEFVAPDAAYFFPIGIPDLFIECYAPAPYLETVNTLALRRYAKQQILDFDKGVEIETQQNVLPLCTLPGVLVQARAVAGTTGTADPASGEPPPPPAPQTTRNGPAGAPTARDTALQRAISK